LAAVLCLFPVSLHPLDLVREQVYDYSSGAGRNKWVHFHAGSGFADPPEEGPEIEKRMFVDDYSSLTASDDRWLITATERYQVGYQLFKIRVEEKTHEIKKLYIAWEGHAQDHGVSLSIWNYHDAAWKQIGRSNPGDEDVTISSVIYAPLEEYKKSLIYLLVTHEREGLFSRKLFTDFIQCTVYSTNEAGEIPSFVSLATDSKGLPVVDLDFTLPVAAAPGTVKMTFRHLRGKPDSASPHVITFASSFESAGRHMATINGSDLSGNPVVAAVNNESRDALVDGSVYEVKIEFQDAELSDTAEAFQHFAYDMTPPVISQVAPAGEAVLSDTRVSYHLSEEADSATITWVWTGGAADTSSPHVQSLQGIELKAGRHEQIILADPPGLAHGAVYSLLFNAADPAGQPARTVVMKNVTYDLRTEVPLLALPAPGSLVTTSDVDVDFMLLEDADSGTVKLVFKQVAGRHDSRSPHVMVFKPSFESAGQHSTVLNVNDLSDNPNVLSVSSDTADALVSGATYKIKLSYRDTLGNPVSAVINSGLTYDVSTEPPILSFPLDSSCQDSSLAVEFTLPEDALKGTVRMTFIHTGDLVPAWSPRAAAKEWEWEDGVRVANLSDSDLSHGKGGQSPLVGLKEGSHLARFAFRSEQQISNTHTIVLPSGREAEGTYLFSLNGNDLSIRNASQSKGSQSGPGLVDGGIYDIVLAYQDNLGHGKASDTCRHMIYDVTSPDVTLNNPAWESTVNSPLVSYSLSEDISSGSISWTRTGGEPDSNSPHIGRLRGKQLLAGEHSQQRLFPEPRLVVGSVYTVSLEVEDRAGNKAAVTPHTNITMRGLLHLLEGFK
ncbi:hypothetical protein ACFL5V_12800, partial [Fibrobacterota bacterium]